MGLYANAVRGKSAIVRDLRATFPAVRFRVTKTQGVCVDVYWFGGPGVAEVNAVIGKYRIEDQSAAWPADDRCLVLLDRSQTCPRCDCDVYCPEPTDNLTDCCVCDAAE